MSGLFASRGSTGEPWFRVGRLEVGSTMAVVLAVVASWLAWVFALALTSKDLTLALAYAPGLLADGEVWRLVTWPFANGLDLWAVISLFFLWYFGTDLEQTIGRKRMAWLLLGIWASLTAAATLVGLLIDPGFGLFGIRLVEFAILLVWIAEYPDRRFMFNIPAWVFGLVLVGLQVLQMIAFSDYGGLLSLLLSLALVAIVARRVGLLGSYAWIPGGPPTGRQRVRTRRPASRRPSGSTARAEARYATDRERLDALLDQINDKGLNSLSDAQRKELLKLRERLRRS